VLGAAGGILAFKFPNMAGLTFPQAAKSQAQNDFWKSRPGEWVMFAFDKNNIAYYFKPNSVQIFGDKIAYTARYPTIKPPEGSQSPLAKATYEETETAMDCKKSMQVVAEKTVYNESGDVISHFKRGDPQSLDFSSGEQIPSGSIFAMAQHMLCDEQLRTPLRLQISKAKLSFLSQNANGNGDIFAGPTKKISDSGFQLEALTEMRMYQNRDVKELYPGQNIIGLPHSYRNAVSRDVGCDRLTHQTKTRPGEEEYPDRAS
jgi:hypothetical protein